MIGQGGTPASVNSFILEMKELTEGFTAMSFLHHYYGRIQANSVTHEERSAGMGSDRMVEMILLFLHRFISSWLV